MALNETVAGRLVRDGGGFALIADDGRRLRLILGRMPVDAVEKRVWVTGTAGADDQFEADGVSLGTPLST